MAAPPPATDRARQPLLLLALAVFLLHLLVTGGHVMSPDEELMFRMTESIALNGSTRVVPLEGDLATGFVDPALAAHTFATRRGAVPGEFFAQYLPLQPLLSAPLVWLATLVEGPLAEPFARCVARGMATAYVETLPEAEQARALFRRGVVVMLFNPLVAALSALALARLGRLLTGSRRAGVLAAALWAFGTVAWPHSRTYFTEPLAGLFALLAFDALCRWHVAPGNSGRKQAVLTGVFLGLANWTRVDSPFFTVGIIGAMTVLGALRFAREESQARVDRRSPWFDVFLAGSLAFGAWIALQTFNTLRFGGGDITSGYGDQAERVDFSTPLLIGLHGLLMSPGKGLFFFSPALLLGVWGWFRIPCHLRWVRWTAVAAFLPFFVAMVKWQNWDGGWCWGPRHVVQVHLPLMLGAVFLAAAMNAKRLVAGAAILVASAGVQLYGSSQNPLDYYREYFMTPEDGEYFTVNLRDLQAAAFAESFLLTQRNRDGSAGRAAEPSEIPAPMIDSLYLPQHTQWYAYARMWRLGYCDLYFYNLLARGERPSDWREKL